jgi:leader peptidase (prepilin peptidase)/N-methyltransferase
MDFLMLAIVFVFGTIIGSFLNVVVYRYNSGTSPLTGRSQCFACGKTLAWYELVPLLSFLIQRGRCRKCQVRLSWQYPLVEIISGVMFVAIFLLGKPLIESAYLVVIFSTLLVIAVYDLRHQIIPDGLAVLFAGLALVWFVFIAGERAVHFPYLWTLIAGPMLFFPFWALWFVSQGRWLGLGDGKLALGIGWFLGATLGSSAVMLAFWIGAAWALTMMAIQRIAIIISKSKVKSQKSKVDAFTFLSTFDFRLSDSLLSLQSEIPFGPFLILGVVIVYFTGVNFFDGSITFSFL